MLHVRNARGSVRTIIERLGISAANLFVRPNALAQIRISCEGIEVERKRAGATRPPATRRRWCRRM